jgi:hypothetical protein
MSNFDISLEEKKKLEIIRLNNDYIRLKSMINGTKNIILMGALTVENLSKKHILPDELSYSDNKIDKLSTEFTTMLYPEKFNNLSEKKLKMANKCDKLIKDLILNSKDPEPSRKLVSFLGMGILAKYLEVKEK